LLYGDTTSSLLNTDEVTNSMNWTQYTVLMLSALFVLFGVVVYSVVRQGYRKRRSFFGDRPVLRNIGCTALFIAASIFVYDCTRALSTGHIRVVLGGGFHTSSHPFTIYRATDPDGFWEAICIHYYLSIVIVYMLVGEVLVFVRQKKVKQKSPA
jgi:hypothetical protein